MARLIFHLLGKTNLTLDGTPLQTDRRKALALLVYLARASRPITREHLADLFWQEFDRERAFAYLRRTLWEINQMLGEGWLQASREHVHLNPHRETWLDAQVVEQAARQASPNLSTLEEAVSLYEGDFLAGFSLRDCPDFEQWQLQQAESLRQSMLQALHMLCTLHLQAKQFEQTAQTARRWLTLDPLDEAAYRTLMISYASAGKRSQALKTYQDCVHNLEKELGAVPEEATHTLAAQIRAGQLGFEAQALPQRAIPAKPAQPSPARPPKPNAHLPLQPTRFVGRGMELLEIRRLLTDPSCRLLTLLGPGGIGKTRLCVEAASQILLDFPHGAHFAALASLTSPDQILPELTTLLELTFSEESIDNSRDHLSQLLDFLRPRQLLLILDNFEHLLEGAPLLSALLTAAPGLKILVTSRERLNSLEEWIFEIEGMSYPLDERARDLESYSSIQLFLSAARRSLPGFQLQPANQPFVARICRVLQGMPLGIELAAAWVRILPPQQIAAEIERDLDFLSTPQRSIPERHRNLRAIFQHSWALLQESEQTAYCRLAVFRGGFTHHQAQQVSALSLPELTALVDKSLVRHFSDGRFDLHEVLLHYATEKLAERPTLQAEVEAAHSQTYLNLLAAQQPLLRGSQLKEAHAILTAEFDNLRKAFQFAVRNTSAASLLEPIYTFIFYIETNSRHVESTELIRGLLPHLRQRWQTAPHDEALAILYATCLIMLGQFEQVLERSSQAQPLFSQAYALIKDLPPSHFKALALVLCGFGSFAYPVTALPLLEIRQNYHEAILSITTVNDLWGLALAYISHSDFADATPEEFQTLYDETLKALQIFTEFGSEWGQAFCYNRLSHFIDWRSNIQFSRANALKAAEIYRKLGDSYRLISAQFHLGQIEASLGNFEQAKHYYADNLLELTRLGRRYFIASHQDSIGYIELLQGNFCQAEALFQSSLEIYQALNHTHGIGMSYSNLGDAAFRRGNVDEAQALQQQGLACQLQIKEPWGITICLKKLGLVAFAKDDVQKANLCWRQALSVAVRFMFIPEGLELLVYLARVDEQQHRRCRALKTLLMIRGNHSLSHEIGRMVEEQLARLQSSCTTEELAEVQQLEHLTDIQQWITENLGIALLSIEEISLPE